MGRKRTRLNLTKEDRMTIDYHLKTTQDVRERERLNFAIVASTGSHTLEDLAHLTGRSRSTIQNWLSKFSRGGLSGLRTRDAAPGKESPLASKQIQEELVRGLKRQRWTTAQQVADWLLRRHGIKRARKSIYYWRHKFC